MWNRLTDEERDLLFTLTKSYVWVRPEARTLYFHGAWNKLLAQLPAHIQTVAIVPLLKPGSKQPKSSGSVFYDYVEGYHDKLIEDLSPRKLLLFKSMGQCAKKLANTSNAALVLVDDYVGSGDTAKAVLAKVPTMNSSMVMVLAFVTQSGAIDLLRSHNCTLIANRVLRRGISDNSELPDIAKALDVMDRLGRRLSIHKGQRLGYGGAEALVTLTRTPNNTFPVYWTNRKVPGGVWDSPFTRYTSYGR